LKRDRRRCGPAAEEKATTREMGGIKWIAKADLDVAGEKRFGALRVTAEGKKGGRRERGRE
jgi:hypothetical protein